MARHRRFALAVLVAALVVVLAGCGTPRAVRPPVSSQPELLSTAPLQLADTCIATGSFMVAYTVLQNGRTGDIKPSVGPPCVQQALTAWVSSFRYAPQSGPVAASVEWLAVTAKKGS